jgi:NAD(P)-dependent dehydrogenase (short-subunit alcohol dehydrogenase family)
MAKVLITGANRGIGLELCRQFQERGDTVIAACRSGNDELDALGVRIIDGADVSEDAGVTAMAAALGNETLDILVNNAGILRPDTLDSVDYDSILEQYRVNTIGPLRVTRSLMGNLQSGSTVGIVTSRVGSLEDNSSGNNYGYRCSKAAANMVGLNLHHDLSPKGITVLLLHPSYVRTDMTGGSGMATTEESAQGLITCLTELGPDKSGTFWHAEGYELPW